MWPIGSAVEDNQPQVVGTVAVVDIHQDSCQD